MKEALHELQKVVPYSSSSNGHLSGEEVSGSFLLKEPFWQPEVAGEVAPEGGSGVEGGHVKTGGEGDLVVGAEEAGADGSTRVVDDGGEIVRQSGGRRRVEEEWQ